MGERLEVAETRVVGTCFGGENPFQARMLLLAKSEYMYYGRNLITQGMYPGRLSYWLYSLGMNKQMRDIVQKYADILYYGGPGNRHSSRPPTTEWYNGLAEKNRKRIRRWVAQGTATGPRTRGLRGSGQYGLGSARPSH